MKEFEENVAIVMNYLKAEGFSHSVVSTHKICYRELQSFLEKNNKDYSLETAYQWIDRNKSVWSYRKTTGYRHCINQLEDVRKTGIISKDHLSFRKPACLQLNSYYRFILDEFVNKYPSDMSRCRIAGARFLLYIQDAGVNDITKLNYDVVLRFYKDDYHISYKSKDAYSCYIRKLLTYLADKGLCSIGLALALNKLLIHQIIKLTEVEINNNSTGKKYTCFTNRIIDSYINDLSRARYGKTVLNASRHILTLLYIFLDMHCIVLNDGILWYWFNQLRSLLGTSWKQHRRTLCQFLHYLEYNSIQTDITGNPEKVHSEELLAEWQLEPFKNYLRLLDREGWQPSTIAMHKSSNLRFCKFLRKIGIKSFAEITPSVLNDFNIQDIHSTPEGKAAYNCRIRSFIIYLYEQHLLNNPYLFKALPTVAAPRASIVKTLSKNDLEKIWSVNSSSLTPTEQRDYAIVCIGLTMGFRASDIINLCFNNIDWKQRSIRIVQQKTGKNLIMPMPVKTGNILFLYLRDGRPKSDEPYIFINHRAPYGKLNRTVCARALSRFVSPSNDEAKGGFHIVRKTFATQLLESNTKIDLISDSLGHTSDDTIHKYLSLDEKRMRMCSLSLKDAGISYKGGAFYA